jgi:RNA polymerase sigma factor (sigma-70 family)
MSPEEFNKLVTRIIYSLKPFALSLTRNMDDANDLMQEAIYKAIKGREKYEEGTNLKAWLHTIMKNIFINNYRTKINHAILLDNNESLFIPSAGSRAQNSGEMNIAVAEITREIDKLTDDYRTPFLMHFEGFKYHEIADHLTLPIGTVKSRIHFARKELKRSLSV